MRYVVVETKRFRKSLRRIQKQPRFRLADLETAVTLLSSGKALPARFRDHQLKGALANFRECHLAPDILLVYQRDDAELVLVLVTIGTHAGLFKK